MSFIEVQQNEENFLLDKLATLADKITAQQEFLDAEEFGGILSIKASTSQSTILHPLFWSSDGRLGYLDMLEDIMFLSVEVDPTGENILVSDPHGQPVHTGLYFSVVETIENDSLFITPTEAAHKNAQGSVMSAIVLNLHRQKAEAERTHWKKGGMCNILSEIYKPLDFLVDEEQVFTPRDFLECMIQGESSSYSAYMLSLFDRSLSCGSQQ